MKRLIALRKRHRAFGRGTLEFLQPEQPQGAGVRPPLRATSTILVVANLSRFVQYVELDLAAFEGMVAGRAVRPHARSRRSASCPTC